MMVDVVTYLFNFLAERLKQNDVAADVKNAPGYQPVNGVNVSLPREWRLRRLVLELVPPGISVATLVVVTVAATRKAWIILQEDSYIRQQPNLTMMLVFSILNLFLDVLNVSCFARVDQAVGLPGQGAQSHADNEPASKADRTRTIANRPGDSSEDTTSFITESTPLVQSQNDVSKDNKLRTNSDKRGTDDDTASEEEDDSSLDATGTMNLNMCSAWTHVCADTYRSIAVLMASGVAFLFPTVCTPLQADSGGAIVVSIIILISLVPLIQALYLTACKIRDIWIAESDGAHHHHYYHSHDLAQFYQA